MFTNSDFVSDIYSTGELSLTELFIYFSLFIFFIVYILTWVMCLSFPQKAMDNDSRGSLVLCWLTDTVINDILNFVFPC